MTTSAHYFPSRYLKASDINGDTVGTIIEFGEVSFRGSEKVNPVIRFKELDKSMVLNATNFKITEALYGSADNWVSKKVTLYVAEVQWKGDMVPGLRIRKEIPEEVTHSKPVPVFKTEDDDIPF